MLEEKAEDLGRVLGQTDEYKALRRATEALREDQAVQKVLAEAEHLAQEKANFEKLMAKINARIYEGIKKGAASPIITLG
ncbi:MAG: hypothetical protein DMD48_05230 [Gemmatimonadetes bacterium]|nr:MAG: hypothetical protein DMD48_05230 [Gemmatimonadota bacterium]